MSFPIAFHRRYAGFTLVEMTIVLIIVALLIGGMFGALSTSRDINDAKDVQKQIAGIQEAILGFAASQGRMPCPASAASNGLELFCESAATCAAPTTTVQTHGRCAVAHSGFVPAATLGISPTTPTGLASDAWGNGIRYAVTQARAGVTIDFPFTANTVAAGIRPAWAVSPFPLAPDLVVCNTADNVTNPGVGPYPAASPYADCPASDRLTNSAVAVVFSTGKNGRTVPTSNHELANWTTSIDRVFVQRGFGPDFDDVVSWISPNTLYNRMISAGRLP